MVELQKQSFHKIRVWNSKSEIITVKEWDLSITVMEGDTTNLQLIGLFVKCQIVDSGLFPADTLYSALDDFFNNALCRFL